MLKCGVDDAQLQSFTDGELPPGEASRLSGHIPTCAHCRRRLADAARLRALVREALDGVAPDLEAPILFAVGRDRAAAARARIARRHAVGGVAIALGAAGAAWLLRDSAPFQLAATSAQFAHDALRTGTALAQGAPPLRWGAAAVLAGCGWALQRRLGRTLRLWDAGR